MPNGGISAYYTQKKHLHWYLMIFQFIHDKLDKQFAPVGIVYQNHSKRIAFPSNFDSKLCTIVVCNII